MQLEVDTAVVAARVAGVQDIAERLSSIRIDREVDDLGAHSVRGGVVEASAAAISREWLQLLTATAADVSQAAHNYEQSALLYEAIEHKLAADAVSVGRGFATFVRRLS